jgi:capsular polysaccharide biosynthesis protein
MPGLSPRALQFLRGDESIDDKVARHRRIFLARKNMKWRRLLNEEEIAADLSKLGFETIVIEEMTARQQIDLFKQALWVVAPNGSALLNLIFADPTVKLVVLTQPNLFNWGTFHGPMASLGYRSVCVCGDYAVAKDQKHSDYRVPVRLIRQALADIGMNEALV